MNVNNIDPFYWGDTPSTASNVWLPLVDNGTITPYGQDFLTTTQALTTTGCPDPPAAPAAKPANLTAPSITDASVVGQTISGTPGLWTGNPTLTYQWLRCNADGAQCASIGDTGLSYVLTSADVGSRLQLLVTAMSSGGVSTATSELSPIVSTISSTGSSPLTTTPGPPAGGVPSGDDTARTAKLSMGVRIVKVMRRGHRVTVTVRYAKRSGTLTATATKVVAKRVNAPHRRLKGHRENSTTMSFTGRLAVGAWVISVTGKPVGGFRAPKAVRRTIRIKSP